MAAYDTCFPAYVYNASYKVAHSIAIEMQWKWIGKSIEKCTQS